MPFKVIQKPSFLFRLSWWCCKSFTIVMRFSCTIVMGKFYTSGTSEILATVSFTRRSVITAGISVFCVARKRCIEL